MYRIVDENGNVYVKFPYTKEDIFERMVVSNIGQIFGTSGIYFDVKKLIGVPKKGAAIPDGYYLDLLFHDNPRLYFVEVELDSHDVYGHVGEQILRFGICSDTDKYKIKQILLSDINKDTEKKKKLADFFAKSKFDNTNELLDKVVYDNKPATIVVINEATEELSKVLGQLTMATEVIEAQTFVCGDKKLHLFTPFGLIKDESIIDAEELPDPIESGEEAIAQLEEAVDLLKSVVRELKALSSEE